MPSQLNGVEYVFAHNGTLSGGHNLEIGDYRPVGDTDSEYAFCHIMHLLQTREIVDWTHRDFQWLESSLKNINTVDSTSYSRMVDIYSVTEIRKVTKV